MFLSLVLAWLISYLCLVRGLSSSKRVVYVASTFPYVILTLFFAKALTLKGMSDGIYYFFEPEVMYHSWARSRASAASAPLSLSQQIEKAQVSRRAPDSSL